MSSYTPGDWKNTYQSVVDDLGQGLSNAELKYLRVIFMKAEDQMLSRRNAKKSINKRLRDPSFSRRGSFH